MGDWSRIDYWLKWSVKLKTYIWPTKTKTYPFDRPANTILIGQIPSRIFFDIRCWRGGRFQRSLWLIVNSRVWVCARSQVLKFRLKLVIFLFICEIHKHAVMACYKRVRDWNLIWFWGQFRALHYTIVLITLKVMNKVKNELTVRADMAGVITGFLGRLIGVPVLSKMP